ncbi:MAG: DMT family transporter [Hyphomicrobiaceae bacterium]
MDTLFIPLSLAAGALLAVQAGANAQLAKATCSPFAATTLQLAVGALLLLVFTVLSGTISALSLLPSAQWWHAIGGVASAFYVVAGILLFPRIGAVVSVGLFIAGQVLASAALDVFGLLGLPATGLGLGVSIGAAMVISGASLIVLGQKGAQSEVAQLQLGWIALGLLAGAVLPVQGAVNALLRHDLGGATFLVGTISFVVATLAMAATLIGTTALPGAARPSLVGVQAMPWWGWLGGFAGATYVTTAFTAIPAIGAALTVGLTVAGQQVASVFVDRYGWFRLPQRPVTATRLVGIVLLLAGVAAIKLI